MKSIFFLSFILIILSNCSAQFGNAILLDGSIDYIEIPDNSYLELNNNFTIEVWIQPLKTLGIINIFNKGMCSSDNYSYNLAAIDGKIDWMWYSSGSCTSNKSRYESLDSVLAPDECAFISIVHTTSSVKIFLNGYELPGQFIFGGSDFSIHNSSANVRIGVYKTISGFENYFWGKIDELRVWNYAKTDSEILSDMYALLTGNESGLVAYYDMEDSGSGSGITITNKAIISGSQLNGTTYGTASTPFFSGSCISTNNFSKTSQYFSVFPNPAYEFLNIRGSGNYQVQIMDILGNQIILQKNLSNISKINISNLKNGIYFLKIIGNNEIYNKVIVKI